MDYDKKEKFVSLIDEIIDTGVDSLFAINQILAQIYTEEICEGKTMDPDPYNPDGPDYNPYGPDDPYGPDYYLVQLTADPDFIDYKGPDYSNQWSEVQKKTGTTIQQKEGIKSTIFDASIPRTKKGRTYQLDVFDAFGEQHIIKQPEHSCGYLAVRFPLQADKLIFTNDVEGAKED